jgi:hypothetical protein
MSNNDRIIDNEMTVGRREGIPAAKRITEAEFQTHTSEWLTQASSGQQIIIVDETDHQKVKMVVGMNGVVFKVADQPNEITAEETQAKKDWLE